MPKIDEETRKAVVLDQCNDYIREMTGKSGKMDTAIKRFEKKKNAREDQMKKIGQKVLDRRHTYIGPTRLSRSRGTGEDGQMLILQGIPSMSVLIFSVVGCACQATTR